MIIKSILITLMAVLCGDLVALANESSGADYPRQVILAVASPESFDTDLPVLKYAIKDLERSKAVFAQAVGARAADIHALISPSKDDLQKKFSEVQKIISRHQGRVNFIFYYTGHSDQAGLHLKNERLGRAELHNFLEPLGADAKIVMIDGCYSGALAAKGIKPADSFSLPRVDFDQPTGSVFLAATSASSVAFEVGEIEGSLFTHHIVGGLYGNADFNNDNLVTIDELYQYTYRQVKIDNLALPVEQKPEFRSNLQGAGALVIARLQGRSHQIQIGRKIKGELSFASSNGFQVFRLNIDEQNRPSIKLPPGSYDVRLKTPFELGKTSFRVGENSSNSLNHGDFSLKPRWDGVQIAKGGLSRASYQVGLGLGAGVRPLMSSAQSLEVSAATSAIPFHNVWLQAAAGLGATRGSLHYKDGRGTILLGTLRLGGRINYFLKNLVEGQKATLDISAGAGQTSYSWSTRPSTGREYHDAFSLIGATLSTSMPTKHGMVYGIGVRRDWGFFTIKNTEDVVALSQSSLIVFMEF